MPQSTTAVQLTLQTVSLIWPQVLRYFNDIEYAKAFNCIRSHLPRGLHWPVEKKKVICISLLFCPCSACKLTRIKRVSLYFTTSWIATHFASVLFFLHIFIVHFPCEIASKYAIFMKRHLQLICQSVWQSMSAYTWWHVPHSCAHNFNFNNTNLCKSQTAKVKCFFSCCRPLKYCFIFELAWISIIISRYALAVRDNCVLLKNQPPRMWFFAILLNANSN